MQVIVLATVRDFLDSLDPHLRPAAYNLIDLLEEYGRSLTMPVAKPIGGGLWELRLNARPAIRILYGFCADTAVLVLAVKKQRPAFLSREIEIARRRLRAYCS